jgi:hypothetical protein
MEAIAAVPERHKPVPARNARLDIAADKLVFLAVFGTNLLQNGKTGFLDALRSKRRADCQN